MRHKSKHLIDLTHIFSPHWESKKVEGPSHTKDIHKNSQHHHTTSISSPTQTSTRTPANQQPTPQQIQNTTTQIKRKLPKINIVNDKTKEAINNIFSQLKTSMQFVGLTIIIFIMLFGLSNFSAYKEIVSYWYKTEVIQAEKEETPVDKLIKPLEKQKTENIIFNKGQISYVNFQVRPSDYRIYIPKINKNLPIVDTPKTNLINQNWSALEKEIQNSLRKGVVHYPGTAEPGEIGNVFLTAHSSWYPNDPLPYGLSSAFALLDKLVVGDEVYVFHNGYMYIYKVNDKYIVKPSNVEVLNQPADRRQMTLMTCHPVGTTLSRKIIELDLTYPKFDNQDGEDIEKIRENLYVDGKLQA